VENKRSEAAEVEGIASTRLVMTPDQGKRCTQLRHHSSRGFLSLAKSTVRVFHNLISLSAISALERSRELTAAAAEGVNKKLFTSSIESLTSDVHAVKHSVIVDEVVSEAHVRVTCACHDVYKISQMKNSKWCIAATYA